MSRTKIYVPLEAEVQTSVINILNRLKWEVCVRRVGAMKIGTRFIRFEKPGRADLYGTIGRDGRHFELEIKRPGERPSALQMQWLRSHNNDHNVGFWVDSTIVLMKVARHLMIGGCVEYTDGTDYDLVFPE